MTGRACLLILLALLLAACGSSPAKRSHHAAVRPPLASAPRADGVDDDVTRPQDRRYRDEHDSVPDGPLDLSQLVEPVPRAEPRSLYGNKSPYTVRGKTYRVLTSAHGYDEIGLASFYGSKFNGYKTSSLETYDMYGFSAAHKTLPLPSYARVTNLDNGKSVIVRINDRGPFHAGRIIDLSYAAAVKIGVWPRGTARVEVRAIDPADRSGTTTELSAPAAVPTVGGLSGIYLQVGAFAESDNADRLAQRLRQAHLGPVRVISGRSHGQAIRRVQVGPFDTLDQADQRSARIEDLGLPRPQLAVD